jgi:hypothetical protein
VLEVFKQPIIRRANNEKKMNKRGKLVGHGGVRRRFLFFVFVWMGALGLASSAKVEYVASRDYFPTVQRELDRARSSVTVCLYLYVLRANQFESPVFQLTRSLVQARDRGVRVEVYLDQNIDFVRGDSLPLAGKNAAAVRYLKSNNIPVFFDSPSTLTHAKTVIIDSATVLLGSSNWTDSAFRDNVETNVLVRSPSFAHEVLTAIHARAWTAPSPDQVDPGVPIAVDFLRDKDLFGRMVSAGDNRALDTALFLAREQTPVSSATFSVSYEKLADCLGITELGSTGARRQINKTLAKLQNRYKVIEARTEYGKDVGITLFMPEDGPWVRIPSTYWTLGWTRRLSFAGKALFLMGLAESDFSPVRPRWSRSREGWARRYHCSPWFVTQGTMDLRRNNLLEVEYAPFDSNDPSPRHPAFYTPNELYDPAELDRAIEALRAVHGPEKVARAQEAVGAVFEDSDLNGIKTLINLENQFGVPSIQAALARIRQKNPDNPRRTIAYLIAMIRESQNDR